jgi:geranylgeranyl diphosphate synthase type II
MNFSEIIEHVLDEVLPKEDARPAILSQAMRYAVGTGGKRVRPRICLAAALAAGGNVEDARYPAAAIELLHNYTLVHDDLPAMDNDVERRGKMSVWKKFGEANAILAGDALLALAYKTAALSPRNVARIIEELGEKGVGVVQGQVEDIEEIRRDIDFIYLHKTADLFIASAAMGALAVGADEVVVEKLKCFARNLGLAFQYQDDLLDGDSPYDTEKTQLLAKEATCNAVAALQGLPGDVSELLSLAESLLGRKW